MLRETHTRTHNCWSLWNNTALTACSHFIFELSFKRRRGTGGWMERIQMWLLIQIYMRTYIHKYTYICSYISALPICSKNSSLENLHWHILLSKGTNEDKFSWYASYSGRETTPGHFVLLSRWTLQSSLNIQIYYSKYQIYPLKKFEITPSNIFFPQNKLSAPIFRDPGKGIKV